MHALLDAAGKRPVAVLATHAHLDHMGTGGVFAGDDIPVFVHEADAVAFTDLPAWGAGGPNPLAEVKDLRTIADGDVLTFAGFSHRGRPHAGPHARPLLLPDRRAALRGDLVFAGSIGRSDFPNCDPDAMQASLRRFLTLPDELPVLPGHGPRHDGRARARLEPVPRGARLMELRPPRGTADLLTDRADAMLGLYEEAHRARAALRLPLPRDADVRAHRAVRAHARATPPTS